MIKKIKEWIIKILSDDNKEDDIDKKESPQAPPQIHPMLLRTTLPYKEDMHNINSFIDRALYLGIYHILLERTPISSNKDRPNNSFYEFIYGYKNMSIGSDNVISKRYSDLFVYTAEYIIENMSNVMKDIFYKYYEEKDNDETLVTYITDYVKVEIMYLYIEVLDCRSDYCDRVNLNDLPEYYTSSHPNIDHYKTLESYVNKELFFNRLININTLNKGEIK